MIRMNIKDKRQAGLKLGRKGISDKIDEYVNQYIENRTPINAAILAGELKVMAEVSTCDDYWGEKAWIGENKAEIDMELIRIDENNYGA